MALFEALEAGSRFPRSEWPAHVTLASNFLTAEPVERVASAVLDAISVDRPLTFRFGGLSRFGPQGDIPVRVAESPVVDEIHRALADRLGGLQRFEADEPSHWRDGYRPHLTLRPAVGVGAAHQEVRTASHVAVARLNGSGAEVVACFEIGCALPDHTGTGQPAPGRRPGEAPTVDG